MEKDIELTTLYSVKSLKDHVKNAHKITEQVSNSLLFCQFQPKCNVKYLYPVKSFFLAFKIRIQNWVVLNPSWILLFFAKERNPTFGFLPNMEILLDFNSNFENSLWKHTSSQKF